MPRLVCGLLALALAAVGCSVSVLQQERRDATARAWILWGEPREVVSSPAVLRPLESFSTRGECESNVVALNRAQGARLDKLIRENKQRATEGAAVVKELREKRGWTQEELAWRARVTEETVAKVEAGHDVSMAVYSLNLAQAFVLSISDLSQYSPRFPTNFTTNAKCWPDTVDPGDQKGR
jgi:DNA-binding XRE family transcriptional regulator